MKATSFGDSYRREFKLTVLIYLGLFFLLIAFISYIGRNVIFKPWTARNYVSTVIIGGDIYAFGGKGEKNILYKDILNLDLNNETIRTVTDLPTERIGISSVVLDKAIYLVGGFDGNSYLAGILKFDPEKKEVKEIGSLPFPVAFGDMVEIEGMLYHIGGWDGEKIMDAIIKIDPKSGKTSVVGYLPQPLEYFSALALQGKIYVLGGEAPDGKTQDQILEIDPDGGKVLRVANLPRPRVYFDTATLNGRIYVAGGWNHGPLNDVIEIDPVGPRIAVRTIQNINKGQAHAGLVAYKNKLYLIGGADYTDRQIGIQEIDLQNKITQEKTFTSYSWW